MECLPLGVCRMAFPATMLTNWRIRECSAAAVARALTLAVPVQQRKPTIIRCYDRIRRKARANAPVEDVQCNNMISIALVVKPSEGR